MSTTSPQPRVLVTQQVPESALTLLRSFARIDVNPDRDEIWTRDQVMAHLPGHDALYCMLTNPVDGAVLDAEPAVKIVANVAVGFNNVDLAAATQRGVAVTNTPGVLTDTTADFAWALLLTAARRVAEGDRFTRDRARAERRLPGSGIAAGRSRFCLPARELHPADTPPDRRCRIGAHEADRLPDQHGARSRGR